MAQGQLIKANTLYRAGTRFRSMISNMYRVQGIQHH